MIELTSKQRKKLEAQANTIDPVVIVGGAGVTEGVIQKVQESFKSHELLKVKFNEYYDEIQELATKIQEETDSTKVRVIGHVAIFYRQHDDPEKRTVKF